MYHILDKYQTKIDPSIEINCVGLQMFVNYPEYPSDEIFVCLFGFYGISTFVGYLKPNPFLYK